MQRTTVLIVGAGPTGLMMACQLALQNISFLIVEKESGPTKESRALGIQARSLEIFHQMGIADRFLQEGKKTSGLNFLANGTPIQHVPLTGLGTGLTKFPFLLILEQSRTETFLFDFLKKNDHSILWKTEVLSFSQTDKEVKTTVRNKDGKEEEIVSEYIIGSDGAHSIVRHILKIPLAGKTYQQSLFVLDCRIKGDLSRDNLTVSTSDISFAAFFPMTHDRWRIVGEAPRSTMGKNTITFEEVEEDLAKNLKMDLTLSDPAWISLYHAHHRCVSHFRENRAFLLGDAANIHSPIGAQGMNTGLQDAYNLAWKISYVHKGLANEKLLNTYNTERLPFAKKLVETTDRLFNLFVSRNHAAIFLRERILPLFIKQVVTHKKTGAMAFRLISQIGISYHKSLLSENATLGKFIRSAPLPGDRLPYVIYDDGKNIQDSITVHKFQLLLFAQNKQKSAAVFEAIKQYARQINVTVIAKSEETKELYKRFGITDFGYYLVRPDMYIDYRSNSDVIEHFASYLNNLFIK